jgi:hypothetical protein
MTGVAIATCPSVSQYGINIATTGVEMQLPASLLLLLHPTCESLSLFFIHLQASPSQDTNNFRTKAMERAPQLMVPFGVAFCWDSLPLRNTNQTPLSK